MGKTIKVKVQRDGSIDLLDIFKCFSISQLKYIMTLLETDPLFDELERNLRLSEDIKNIISEKKLDEQFETIKEMTLEFKKLVSVMLGQLIDYEKDLQ